MTSDTLLMMSADASCCHHGLLFDLERYETAGFYKCFSTWIYLKVLSWALLLILTFVSTCVGENIRVGFCHVAQAL